MGNFLYSRTGSIIMLILIVAAIFFYFNQQYHITSAFFNEDKLDEELSTAKSTCPNTETGTSTIIQNNNGQKTAMVSLTFDDGFLSAYKLALPILQKANLKATWYLITRKENNPKYMSPQDFIDLQASGQEVGAHTQTHPHLSQITKKQIEDEITGSKNDLESLGIHPTTFAYPYGDYNNEAIDIVKQNGFISARTTCYGANEIDPSIDEYQLLSYAVEQSTNIKTAENAIDSAIKNGEWIIFAFHRVDEDGNAISVRHELIQQLVDYIKEKQVKVVTVSEGIQDL